MKEKEGENSEKQGQIVKTFNDGFYWINLKTSKCDYESEKMGHCGTDDEGELWSLRDKNKQPHITATIDENGVVHQLKGKENNKPVSKYHKYIAELLADPNLIKDITTNKDENDFHLTDLSENGLKYIAERNPNLAKRINRFLGEKKVKEIINSNLSIFKEAGSKKEDEFKLQTFNSRQIIGFVNLYFKMSEEDTTFDEETDRVERNILEVAETFKQKVSNELNTVGIQNKRVLVQPAIKDASQSTDADTFEMLDISVRIYIEL